MKLGLFLSSLGGGPGAYAGMVRAAEESGLHSVWVPDHVLKVFGPVLYPLTALAFLAGSTSRIELGTCVLVLPYRHPVPLANAGCGVGCLSGAPKGLWCYPLGHRMEPTDVGSARRRSGSSAG